MIVRKIKQRKHWNAREIQLGSGGGGVGERQKGFTDKEMFKI